MPTLAQRLQRFLATPQGKRLIAEGRKQPAKPENQRRARQILARLRSRR